MTKQKQPHINFRILITAIGLAFVKLTPWYQLRNPVMFVTYVCCFMASGLYVYTLINPAYESPSFLLHVSIWLWFTVVFANFSESLAEGRGKAQADILKKARREIKAKKLKEQSKRTYTLLPSTELHIDDTVLVEVGDVIPGDGQVIEGIASVDESAITGESAPVIRESGGDRDAVTAGTIVLSDWLIIRITSEPGESFLDKMISLVEGAKRQKTPNEIALSILLAGMTLIFLIVVMTLLPFSYFTIDLLKAGSAISIAALLALLVCLIPTTIGGLMAAIGIAGMDRLIRANVIATSGRAIEAAGDVNILLLDKTGTITLGNRQAAAFFPTNGVDERMLAEAAAMSSIADDTPEGKSIVQLAKEKHGVILSDMKVLKADFIPFSAETRMSGIKLPDCQIFKGAADRIFNFVKKANGQVDETIIQKIEMIARQGSTPLVVCKDAHVLGVVELKDIIKPGIKERLASLRAMGIKSIMMTGDNPLTAATIANEAGVDDFHANAMPEDKLNIIRAFQREGQLVAMVGDGTNDAPALAQTDVAVAMNSGTQAAKEAANMVDLDSDPTKLIEIVKIGKQLLITRGALTTFSIANDLAKYFAIIPAAFVGTFPALNVFNIMQLANPKSAILSAVIFNALIIICLIPLALKGVRYRAWSANRLLQVNVLIYGLGGIIIPFLGIKCIDMLVSRLSWI